MYLHTLSHHVALPLCRLYDRTGPAFLGQVADAVARLARAAAAEQFALAVVGLDDPEQHPERRRLARAVGAQHAVDPPLRHRDVDPTDHAPPAEFLAELGGNPRSSEERSVGQAWGSTWNSRGTP